MKIEKKKKTKTNSSANTKQTVTIAIVYSIQFLSSNCKWTTFLFNSFASQLVPSSAESNFEFSNKNNNIDLWFASHAFINCQFEHFNRNDFSIARNFSILSLVVVVFLCVDFECIQFFFSYATSEQNSRAQIYMRREMKTGNGKKLRSSNRQTWLPIRFLSAVISLCARPVRPNSADELRLRFEFFLRSHTFHSYFLISSHYLHFF